MGEVYSLFNQNNRGRAGLLGLFQKIYNELTYLETQSTILVLYQSIQ